MSELNEMGCAGVADAAAELALGVLPGGERARVLAHLGGCGACRENVRQLTMTGEALLGLLPGSEPPLGFETGVTAS
jgi:anti-sigma factor RsiW